MNKFTLYPDSKYDNHATNELPLDNPMNNGIEKAAKAYAFTYSGEDEVLKYEAFKAGTKWMEEELIVWLKNHINDYIVKGRDIDLMFDDLHKAMEE